MNTRQYWLVGLGLALAIFGLASLADKQSSEDSGLAAEVNTPAASPNPQNPETREELSQGQVDGMRKRRSTTFVAQLTISWLGGEEGPPPTGVARIRKAAGGETLDLPFTRGVGQADVPLGEWHLVSLLVSGTDDDIPPSEAITFTEESPKHSTYLVGDNGVARGSLIVVDAATGLSLTSVEVWIQAPLSGPLGVDDQNSYEGLSFEPRSDARLLASGDSPLALPDHSLGQMLLVRAAAYSWKSVAAIPRGETRKLTLSRCGELLVEVSSSIENARYEITIETVGGIVRRRVRAHQPIELNGIPAGRITLHARVATPSGEGRQVSRIENRVHPGRQTEILITDDVSEMDLAMCSVQVLRNRQDETAVPWVLEWWKEGGAARNYIPLRDWGDSGSAGVGANQSCTVDLRDLSVGTHVMRIMPIGVQRAVGMRPGSSDHILIDATNLVTVLVSMLEDPSSPVDSEFVGIVWGYEDDGYICSPQPKTTMEGFSRGQPFRITCRPGRIRLCTNGWPWESVNIVIDAGKTGPLTALVPVSRQAEFTVELTMEEDGKATSATQAHSSRLWFLAQDHVGQERGRAFTDATFDHGRLRVIFDRPGAYRVVLDGVETGLVVDAQQPNVNSRAAISL